MARVGLVLALGCALGGPAAAQRRPGPPPAPAPTSVPTRPPLEAPEFTIHPQGALAIFGGETVDVVVGWRPVPGAARYRVRIANADGRTTDIVTETVRIERTGLRPGTYQLSVTAIDRDGGDGVESELLPLRVMEVRAVPPGTDAPSPPVRGAYAVGTRFSVAGMHCALNDAPIDDLIVGPENEITMPVAGVTRLRCAGDAGYLEKQVVIAPVSVAAASSVRVARGTTTPVTLTVASVGALGPALEVDAAGDVSLAGPVKATASGLVVSVLANPGATHGTLVVRAGSVELGRVAVEPYDAAPPPPPPAPPPFEWNAFDLGGHFGLFAPPDNAERGLTLGEPSASGDVIAASPLFGVHLGIFPLPRLGLEMQVGALRASYADEASGGTALLAARGQLAVRVLESGSLGLRLIAGSGIVAALQSRGTATAATESEIHLGGAFTVETAPNLWLRLQLADVVMTARDGGYAHSVEVQLGVVTRVGRHDAW